MAQYGSKLEYLQKENTNYFSTFDRSVNIQNYNIK